MKMMSMILGVVLLGCVANPGSSLVVEDFTELNGIPVNVQPDLNVERCIGSEYYEDEYTYEQAEDIVTFCCCYDDEESGLTLCTEY